MSAITRIRPSRPDDAAFVRRLVSDAGLPTAGLDQAWTTLVADDPPGAVVGVAALERHGSPAGGCFYSGRSPSNPPGEAAVWAPPS